MTSVEGEITSSLRFISYNVVSLNFVNNEAFEKAPVSIDFEVSSEIMKKSDTLADVKITLNIFPDSVKNNYPFTMVLSVIGNFEIENVNDSSSLFEVNAVAIMFPYLRALVSTITANANVPPLILPPINVVKLMKNKQDKI